MGIGRRGRLAGALVALTLLAAACGGDETDLVATPRVPGAVLGAVQISLEGRSVDASDVEPGTGVFVVPQRRIVFGDVTCSGDADDAVSVRADGELIETLQRARLQLAAGGGSVEPVDGEQEIVVGHPDEGLAFRSVSGAEIDGDLVSIEGVYEPESPRTPLVERYPGGSFRLVVRCG